MREVELSLVCCACACCDVCVLCGVHVCGFWCMCCDVCGMLRACVCCDVKVHCFDFHLIPEWEKQ